jgi:drug/metabolite transporter (DMT)-like permease
MRRVWIAFAVASIGWGTAGVASRALLERGVGPYTVAFSRALVAAVAVLPLLVAGGRRHRLGGNALRVGLVMGITNLGVTYVVSTIALQYASAGFLGLTTALIPLATALIAHVALIDERLNALRAIGLVIGFSGVATLMASGDSGLEGGGRPVLAGGLSLIAIVAIAVGGVYAKRHAGTYDPMAAAGIQFISGSVMVAVAMGVAEGFPSIGGAPSWWLIAYLGIVSTLGPFVLYYWMIRRVSATFVASSGYLVPPIALVAGVVFLGERLQRGIVLGGILILGGLIIGARAERRVDLA